jgi:hypothetical protein
MSTQHRAGSEAGVRLERPISLVVIEAGAAWPAFLTHKRLAPDCDVLVQQAEESFVALTRRVLARIRMLSSEGEAVALGVIATGTNGSEQAMECRYRIARALVLARATRSAELVFVAGAASPYDDLSALAAALGPLAGADFAVRVRLTGESDSTAHADAAAPDDGSRSRAA